MRPIGIVSIDKNGTSKSLRTTIPKDVVIKLDLLPTDKLVFCENNDGDVILRRIQRT